MKKSVDDKEQLKIRFDDKNPFAVRLRDGKFSSIIEFDTPLSGQSFSTATAMPALLASRLENVPWITGLAVTDRLHGEDSQDPVSTAALLAEKSNKPVILTISGKGSTRKRIRDAAARAQSEGINTILAVTGDRSDKHPESLTTLIPPPPHANGYADSVETIRHLQTQHPVILTAGAVNPFKYNLPDQYLQYCKMLRKLATGASFLTTQAGWDMKKYQELKWFLQMREIEAPVFARLAVLSRQRIQQLHQGFLPGITLSRSFCAVLQRESEISEAQSMAAQMRRFSLQVLGCRLMGFSGVQISGIRNEQTLDLVLKTLSNPPDGIDSYADWVQAWYEYNSDTEFAPSSNAYYMFTNLMQPQRPDYSPADSEFTESSFPHPSGRDRMRQTIMHLLQSAWLPASSKRFLGRRFCWNCQEHELDPAHWFYLCPRPCPKRLVLGACGGSQIDGVCEFGHATCFHRRVLALAAKGKKIDRLEEKI